MRRAVETSAIAARPAQPTPAKRGGREPARGNPPGEIALPQDATGADAFRQVAAALLTLIAAQQPEVRRHDPTGVHQMRIGLRRLRAALSVFAELIDTEQAERFKRELRWSAGRLAPARDLHLMELKFNSAEIDGTSPSFLKRLARDRATAFRRAQAAVEQPRFRALLRDLTQWTEGDAWAKSPAGTDPPPSARQFARAVLTRRARKLIRKLDRLEQFDDEQRHRVRIAAKKLNYAIGFFESLFDGRKSGPRVRRFRKHLKKLLDALGALNDVAVHRELAGQFAGRTKAKLDPAALRQLSAIDRKHFKKQMKAAVKAATKLADDPLFGD